jgi:hypothetical protein
MKKLTQERLKELLHYDPESGVFTWKLVTSKRVKAGDIAGSVRNDGYRVIRIGWKLYLAHRLAVFYMEGYMPEHTVDHKMRKRDDNRHKELREATQQCQSRNAGMLKNNISGVKGVHWNKFYKIWVAQIRINGKAKHLGLFDNILDAAYVRYAAEQCLGYQDCDINSSAKQYIDKCAEATI